MNKFLPFLGIYILLLLLGSTSFPLIDWDENIYGAVAKSILTSGKYFYLSINEQIYVEKPPLFFWAIVIVYKILGINEFATRFTSLLSGIFSFCALFWVGKKLKDAKFGLLWALVYSSSLLPLFLSKTAYIDHLFNLFIFLGVSSFYFYETEESKLFSKRIFWIVLGSVSMGLGALTKGPLAIFIPIFCFIIQKILKKDFQIRILDAFISLILLILVLSIFYLTNYILYGNEFLMGFFGFQNKLLTKSLESHTGPWLYHFMILPICFFPWFPFLTIFLKKEFRQKLFREKSFLFIAILLSWASIVLFVFSFVQTKLPHYSSSIYFCLSYLVAYIVYSFHKDEVYRKIYPLWVSIYGIFIGIFFTASPILLKYITKTAIFQKEFGEISIPNFTFWDYSPGLILIFGFLILLFKNKILFLQKRIFSIGYISLVVSIFFGFFCLFPASKFLDVSQGRHLRLFSTAEKYSLPIVFYNYLAFSPMFYRDKRIHMIGSYKFQNEEEILKFDDMKEFMMITDRKNIYDLEVLFPRKKFEVVQSEAELVLLKVLVTQIWKP